MNVLPVYENVLYGVGDDNKEDETVTIEFDKEE